jgi:hypothetical protein
MIEFIWTWVLTHLPDAVRVVTGIKLLADTTESVKKLAPAKLEVKDAAQAYLTDSLTIAKDQSKDLEERRLELETRSELAESMVRLTAVEATYNIMRFAIFTAFTTCVLHMFTRIITTPKRTQPPVPPTNS